MSLHRLILGLWLMVGGIATAAAEGGGFQIVQARLQRHTDLALTAMIDYRLSPDVEEALRHSIPLTVAVVVRILEPRRWLWDEVLWKGRLRYRIQYYPLSKAYQVVDETQGSQRSFTTREAALEALGNLQEVSLEVPDRILSKHNPNLYVELQVKLDRQKLPWALQPVAYLSRQWQLISQEYQWPLFD